MSVELRKERKFSLLKRMKKKILLWFRLTNDPVLKVYNGYGNGVVLTIFGHVLGLSPLPRKRYSKGLIRNSFSLIRSFTVKPLPKAAVSLKWNGNMYETLSESDGFFRFEWEPAEPLLPGRHAVQLFLKDDSGKVISEDTGEIYVPDHYKYAIISDIDDTFLVSHSSNLRKRLYVLLTKNAHSRRSFEGVVNHYQLLANAGIETGKSNPFFYVSSSEWNLYDMLREFLVQQELPAGIFLLSQIKRLYQVFNTGQGKHTAKFMRIARIVEAFPAQPLILLGDDSQEDPSIYLSLVKHFPGKVTAVYIRKTHKKNYESVKIITDQIREQGVPCCYFLHSSEAVIHSREIGLITPENFLNSEAEGH